MTDKESVNRFRRLVQAQIGCAEKLIKALEQERLALLARDAQELTRVGTSKTTLLREMEQRLQAHETFLKALRLPPGKEGSEALLKTLPKDGVKASETLLRQADGRGGDSQYYSDSQVLGKA
jgi:flagellar biosynthesis/type III secretory pathway chaperone